MPLLRYFLVMGSILLGLLFFASWYFPGPAQEAAAGDIDRTVIRIHSDRHWPAAVSIDTSAPMPSTPPPVIASATPASTPAAAPQEAYAYAPAATRPSDKPTHHARTARASPRASHRRLAYQSTWLPPGW